MDTQAADLTPILNVMLAGYLGCSGVLGLALVRPPLQRWYHSGVWYIAGRGPVDILLKQIGSRLSFEAFTFALACIVGASADGSMSLRARGSPTQAMASCRACARTCEPGSAPRASA